MAVIIVYRNTNEAIIVKLHNRTRVVYIGHKPIIWYRQRPFKIVKQRIYQPCVSPKRKYYYLFFECNSKSSTSISRVRIGIKILIICRLGL